MPTVIDSLLVTLGLDSSKFDASQKKVQAGLQNTKKQSKDTADNVKKNNKEVENSFKGVADQINKIASVVGITLSVQALKNLVVNQVEVNKNLSIFSKNVGVGIEELQKYGNAAQMAGGSFQGMQDVFSTLSKAATDVQFGGTSPLIQYLQHLNVDLVDSTTGKLRKLTDIVDDVHRKVQGRDRPTEFNLAKQFGVSEDTFNLLFKTKKEFDELIAQGQKNAAITKEQGEAYEKQAQALEDVRQKSNKLASDLTLTLMPAIISIGNGFLEAWKAGNKFGEKIGEVLFNWLHPGDANGKNFSPENNKVAPKVAAPTAAAKGSVDPVKFFMDKGLSKEDATAFAANIQAESGGNPNITNPNGINYGIAQWGKPRQADFKAKYGKDIHGSSQQEQLEFMWFELQNKEKDKLGAIKSAQGLAAKTVAVKDLYERPGVNDKEANRRIALAQGLYSGVPGATKMAANSQSSKTSSNVSNRSVEASIGEVKIYTSATDAQGIANSMKPAMNYLLASQADYGLVP